MVTRGMHALWATNLTPAPSREEGVTHRIIEPFLYRPNLSMARSPFLAGRGLGGLGSSENAFVMDGRVATAGEKV